MMYLIYYVLISYLVGFIFFIIEMTIALRKEQYFLMTPGLIILLLSPLTAWHAALHYCQWMYCKLTKQPIKYWI